MPRHEVIKESGAAESYDRQKILKSLLHVDVPLEVAEDIIDRTIRGIHPPLTTRKIFKAVKRVLRGFDVLSQMKYSLKAAIYDLGPSGYPFEKYVGRVLEKRGYRVEVGKFVEGRCVSHEVDILARRDNHLYIVECKFHKRGNATSDVKTALYVHSRFMDIDEAHRLNGSDLERRGMLVTNTRFTSEAVKYAQCVGLRIIGWKHPAGQSLERMIEEGRTYPVTILPAARKSVSRALLENDIVLASEIMDMEINALTHRTGLKREVAELLKRQSAKICG